MIIDEAIAELAPLIGVRAACTAVGRPQANHYRRHRQSPAPVRVPRQRRPQPRALSQEERDRVRELLNSPEFADQAPRSVYYALLDAGVYLCSPSSMYRILHAHGEVHERRRQATHPARKKPELHATQPNQVWSWDITKLHGPAKWTYYYLYVIIDIYSRYVVGWMVADREHRDLAEKLLADTIAKHGIDPDTLTIHADNGSSMASKPVAFLLADLGVTKSHSRPHVSNDNPYSEAQFKTLKYRPDFPSTFGSLQDARAFCQRFFQWYNEEHYHSGVAWLHPIDVHYGQASQVLDERTRVLTDAHARHPERFVNKHPQPVPLPTEAWINKPQTTDEPQTAQTAEPTRAPRAGDRSMTDDRPHPAGSADETPEQRHARHQAQHERDLAILTAGGETGWWDDHGRPAPWPADFFDRDAEWSPDTGNTTHSTSL